LYTYTWEYIHILKEYIYILKEFFIVYYIHILILASISIYSGIILVFIVSMDTYVWLENNGVRTLFMGHGVNEYIHG